MKSQSKYYSNVKSPRNLDWVYWDIPVLFEDFQCYEFSLIYFFENLNEKGNFLIWRYVFLISIPLFHFTSLFEQIFFFFFFFSFYIFNELAYSDENALWKYSWPSLFKLYVYLKYNYQ